MQKNVAGQKIGAQLVSATNGAAFTSAVTVAVTLDAGTQATGTVGSGACTHEGNGYHTYAPSQAETNGTIVAFTFTGSGAVPVTVQVFTTGYDPTVALATASAVATVQTSVDDVPTNAELATSQAAADDATLAAIAALNNLSSAQAQTAAAAALTSYDPPTRAEATSDKDEVLTQVALVKTKTDLIPSDPADASDIAASFSTVNSTLATIAGYIDTEVATIVSAIAGLNNVSEAQVLAQVAAALTSTVADSVPADGTRPSVSSGIYMLVQFLLERTVAGTTTTIKKPDGSTTLFTLTLNDATTPTAITRAS